MQLELRDSEPGTVLGRDAGFWLRGTGVRALRNPGRRTAMVRIVTRRDAPGATEDLRLWVPRVDRCEVHISGTHPTLGSGTDRRTPVDPSE